MRSNEVAKAADVSVRTLRHYHALGLLPEPPRSANGYRDYSAMDVARVLRIKRLASLGLSLADIAKMEHAGTAGEPALRKGKSGQVGDAPASTPFDEEDSVLATLDAELERKIEALQEQRRTIAELRAERLDPTLPAKFARAIKLFYGENGLVDADTMSEETRAALILASHFYTDSDTAELERFAKEAVRIGVIEDLRSLDERFSALPANATAEEQDALVNEAIAVLEPLLGTFDPANWIEEDSADWELFDGLVNAGQNPVQQAVNTRIEEEIAARMRAIADANTRILQNPLTPT